MGRGGFGAGRLVALVGLTVGLESRRVLRSVWRWFRGRLRGLSRCRGGLGGLGGRLCGAVSLSRGGGMAGLPGPGGGCWSPLRVGGDVLVGRARGGEDDRRGCRRRQLSWDGGRGRHCGDHGRRRRSRRRSLRRRWYRRRCRHHGGTAVGAGVGVAARRRAEDEAGRDRRRWRGWARLARPVGHRAAAGRGQSQAQRNPGHPAWVSPRAAPAWTARRNLNRFAPDARRCRVQPLGDTAREPSSRGDGGRRHVRLYHWARR